MASLVSPVIAVLLVVVASSSGVSGCVECFIDREAEQDEVCAIRCVSPGKDGPSVKINGEALRTALDCESLSLETNPYCLWRENGISVGAKIKSSSRRTVFKYDPNTELCGDKCEFSVEFNGPTCSVVSEDLDKPCIKNPPATSAHPMATSPKSDTPDSGIIAGIIGSTFGGALLRWTIIFAAVLIAVWCCFYRKPKRNETTTTPGKGEDLEPDGVTIKSPHVKKKQ